MQNLDNQSLPTCILRSETVSGLASILALVKIDELAKLQEDPEFLKGFSAQELKLVRSRAKGHHSLAARYAAKQAAQALTNLPWTSFEIRRLTDQPPILFLMNQEESLSTYFTLSLSHDEPYALAYLVEIETYRVKSQLS